MEEVRDGILFIDDTEMVLMLVARFTQAMGFRAYTCETEQEAVKIIEENPNIKLVFVDFQLGKGQDHGLNVIKHLRKFQEQRIIKFCLFSGIRDKRVEQHYRSYGAEAFLEKPISRQKFEAIVLSLLETTPEENMNLENRLIIENSPAFIIDSQIAPVFFVKELTLNTMVLESSAEIEEGTCIKIKSPPVGRLLDVDPIFSLKIKKSRSYKKIEKELGENWDQNKTHLKAHYHGNFLLRCLVLDMTQEVQSAIQGHFKDTSEVKRRNTLIKSGE